MTTTDDIELRREIVALDKRYLWHPYTEMGHWIEHGEPLVIHRAERSRLFDVDGRSFIDGNASWWTSLLGHNHPRLVAALTRQASKLSHCSLAGITHEPAAMLAAPMPTISWLPRTRSRRRAAVNDDATPTLLRWPRSS